MTSMVFEKANFFVLKWEGGLTNDANDSGGITKYGVSLKFLQSVDPKATADTIKNLTVDDEKRLFKEHFWDKIYGDNLPQAIAFVLYDTVVNVGVSQGVKFLQRVLGCNDDGKIGKNTLYLANTSCIKEVVDKFLTLRENFYKALVEKKPNQGVFLKGWLNRVTDLRKEVENYLNTLA